MTCAGFGYNLLTLAAKMLKFIAFLCRVKNLTFMFKKIYLFIATFLCAAVINAQVTTSSINGSVKSQAGEILEGATITATHEPSGTKYVTAANKSGYFNMQGLRPGGPYTVQINYVGLAPQSFEQISLPLGESYVLNATLGVQESVLENVIVSGSRKTATDKGGMSSVTSTRQLNTLPTLSRSITDFTRLAPQANGNSFGGRDGRYNNITVDGANLNNNFGLSTDPLPGGGNNPISLDAVQEVSVSLAPYDVRQGNFTGGNIAAVTKSGTNTFHGTAYKYWQSSGLVGTKVAGVPAANPKWNSNIYGASLGGPIIQNKLFFFINGEFEEKPPSAGITYSPKGGSGAGNISSVPVADLQKVSDYVKSTYKYDPGVFDNFAAFKNKNRKLLAKIDWNINTKNKLSIKYSDFKGTQDFQPSQSANIGGTYSGATYGPKFSDKAMAFSGTLYQQLDIVKSGSLEFNSYFSSRFANQFLATFTRIQSDKTHTGDNFPFVDILLNAPSDKNNYISLGNDPFNGNNNKVHNDVLSITNNISYFAGRHNITGGVSYEYQKVGNMFMRGSQGYYVFANINDFVTNQAPLRFAQTYSLIPGEDAIFSAQLKIGQLSVYAQDEININPKLKINFGVRVDKPVFPEQPLENAANTALTFQNQNGQSQQYSTGKWPKASALFSPRASFRYDVLGDKSLIIRGGTGIFTGRIPYVYLTNIPTNSGMYQYSAAVDNTMTGINMNDYKFNPDAHAYNPMYNKNMLATRFPTTAGIVASSDFVVSDPNYKFPQIWRTDLAVDKFFANNWKLTVEALYTKDLNATFMFDANQKNADGTVLTGDYSRPFYTTSAARRINANITGNAMVLASANKGRSFVFTTQIEKSYSNGLSASLAYSYTNAKDLTANGGSQASSVYNSNTTQKTMNDLELSYSSFAIPHRIIGNISYHFEYIKHLGSTISFVFEGANQGRYSYIYSGSVTNQGYNSGNLMYVPNVAVKQADNTLKYNDLTLVSYTYKINGQNLVYTPAQQTALLESYINQDPYLSKNRGQVVSRSGALTPWFNRLDMKYLQDIFTNIGRQKHTLQFSADVYNVFNLLNNRWGIRQLYTLNNPLTVAATPTNGNQATFYLTPYQGGLPPTQTFVNNVSTSTTWAVQFGLRYIF